MLKQTIATCLVVGSGLLAGVPATGSAGTPVPNAEAETTTAESESDTLDLGIVERETVRLVLLDAMVLDRQGQPVPGLTAEDFEIVAAGRPVPVDTLDLRCSTQQPDAVTHAAAETSPGVFEDRRRFILAFDYLHLNPQQRAESFEQARRMVKNGATDGEEVMVAALTGGLRIEQKFTDDPGEVLRSLRRMEYDISLWQRDFWHLNEFGFVDGLTALLDVTGSVPGTKALVLFSGMKDVPLDLQFQEIAAVASASRCFIYPVDASGLEAKRPGIPAAGGG